MININNFEDHVESKILDRGFDYYENDQVEEVDQVDQGEFSALVCGNDDYEVYVRLDSLYNIVEKHCSCPYDWGNTCKHEVALLYYIRDAELHKEQTDAPSQLRSILDDVSDRELRDFIWTTLKKNREFREDFTQEFG